MLCQAQPEDLNFFFLTYSFSTMLWDQLVISFKKSNLTTHSISTSLEKWREYPFSNPILNRSWLIILGFPTSNIQKERNTCIFKSISSSSEEVSNLILSQLQETIDYVQWAYQDLNFPSAEQIILHLLWIKPQYTSFIGSLHIPTLVSHMTQSPPSIIFVKLNFDREYYGNPSPASYD